MKTVIIGARRRRQGTGPFVARAFAAAGAEVTAVVGSTSANARTAAQELEKDAGIRARSYGDVEAALAAERPDAVAVCSPLELHAAHLENALTHSCHCLCEKPLQWFDGGDLLSRTRSVVSGFRSAGLHLDVLTQWPYTLPAFDELYPGARSEKLASFAMHLGPITSGAAMVIDAAPHPLSLLYALAGGGTIVDTDAKYLDEAKSELCLDFRYSYADGEADVRLRCTTTAQPPRPASYAINGRPVERRIRLPEYAIELEAAGRRVDVSDPLFGLVRDFVKNVETSAPVDEDRLVSGVGGLGVLYEAARKAESRRIEAEENR